MSLKNILFSYNNMLQTETDAQFLPSEEQLGHWIEYFDGELQGKVGLSYTVVDQDYIQELNKTYRSKDYPTNVLSFEMDDEYVDEETGEPYTYIGDIIICPKVLEREAVEQEKKLEDHWAHICIHGFLHLLGFDHIEEEEAKEMESKEKSALANLGISDPYRDDLFNEDYLA